MLEFYLTYFSVPDFIARKAARSLCGQRLRDELQKTPAEHAAFLAEMNQAPLFLSTDTANEQHYEVPAEFFQLIMGAHLKYSCCWWEEGTTSLDAAEEAALALTCQRAGVQDGERILELGCGWGSLSLYLAQQYPNARITSVSNSNSQREYIEGQCQQRGLNNLQVITANVGELEFDQSDLASDHLDSDQRGFDRVVSVEMFEHARNYRLLLKKVHSWLCEGGELFVHIFCHKNLVYPFNADGSWMAEHFFKDGLMPSFDIFTHFDEHFHLTKSTKVNGLHYTKTCDAWLENHKRHRKQIIAMFERTYGTGLGKKFWNYWQIFFIACSELFAYKGGGEWFVGHYTLKRNSIPSEVI